MSLTRRPASAITQTGGPQVRGWPVSPLLTAAVTTLVGLGMLRWLGPAMLRHWQTLLAGGLACETQTNGPGMAGSLWPLMSLVASLVAVLAVTGILVTLVQRGGSEPARSADTPRVVFGFRPHQPGLMPLAAIGLLAGGVWKIGAEFPRLMSWLAEGTYAPILEAGLALMQTLALLGLAFGLLDLAWRHYRHRARQEEGSGADADSDEQSPLFRRQMRERMSRM